MSESEQMAAGAELAVRPPRQRRSRETWRRILDAGVALLEDEGYDGFTIAAVCERADVAPTAIYARTTSKDALFLAVYEHGVAALRTDQAAALGGERGDAHRAERRPPSPDELVRTAVRQVVGVSLRHRRFLRSVVLVSATHDEVRRRGSGYSKELGRQFGAAVLAGAREAIDADDPEAAVWACFGTVFSATIIRVAYGPDFATPVPVDDDTFGRDLAETAVRYLLRSS
jgi:AcrR family transcriptional regulator